MKSSTKYSMVMITILLVTLLIDIAIACLAAAFNFVPELLAFVGVYLIGTVLILKWKNRR